MEAMLETCLEFVEVWLQYFPTLKTRRASVGYCMLKTQAGSLRWDRWMLLRFLNLQYYKKVYGSIESIQWVLKPTNVIKFNSGFSLCTSRLSSSQQKIFVLASYPTVFLVSRIQTSVSKVLQYNAKGAKQNRDHLLRTTKPLPRSKCWELFWKVFCLTTFFQSNIFWLKYKLCLVFTAKNYFLSTMVVCFLILIRIPDFFFFLKFKTFMESLETENWSLNVSYHLRNNSSIALKVLNCLRFQIGFCC